MNSTINQRVETLYKLSKVKSIRQYALKLGISPTTLNQCIKGTEPRHSLLLSILNGEPTISAEWLITGRGPMLKSDVTTSDSSEASSNADKELINRLQIENNLLKQIVGVNNPLQKGESA